MREAGHRNLPATLGIFVGGGWAVLQVIDLFIERGFLPDWTFSGAFLALVLGLPVVMSTAWIQGGLKRSREVAETDDTSTSLETSDLADLLTWNRAILGGVLAFALLGVITAGYMVMRVTGIGAPGTLAAQGTFEVGGQVVLADFESSVPDQAPSDLITESLRIDLASSPAIELIERSAVTEALGRMLLDPRETLTEQVARDVAARVGAEGVVSGEIGRVGSRYVLTARLVESESGNVLAGFRETADDEDELLDAIDALAVSMRTKVGESLRSVAASESLGDVTTTSLEALKRYTYVSSRLYRSQIEPQVGQQMLEEAIELDSTFAIANLQLAISIGNWGGSIERAWLAMEQAYRHRARLTDRERLAIEGYYYNRTGDARQAMQAYRQIIELNPDERSARINLADMSMYSGQYQDAVDLLSQVPAPENQVWTWNMQTSLAALGRVEEALAAADAYAAEVPDGGAQAVTDLSRVMIRYVTGDIAGARAELDASPASPGFEGWEAYNRAMTDALSGNAASAREITVGLALAASREGAVNDQVGAVLGLGYLSAWVERDPDGTAAGMEALFDRLDLERLSSRDRLYPTQALALAFAQDDEAVDRIGEQYRSTVDQRSDPEGRARMTTAEALVALTPGDAAGLEQLRDASARMRCARCRDVIVGFGAELTGQTEQAIEAYEAYLATPWFDGSDVMTHMFSTNVHERLGGLYVETGNVEEAREHLGIFIERWANADASLQPRVQAARQLLAGLN
jgi:tetratricopeptide (TPR) repeat protein/TolB-like protein